MLRITLLTIIFIIPLLPSYSQPPLPVNQYALSYSYQPGKYTPNWTCLGPTGTPAGSSNAKGNGQIHRFVFDPRYHLVNPGEKGYGIIYAVSHFGGLWHSEDEGHNWKAVDLGAQLPYVNIGDMAISRQDPNILFLCTGDGDYSYRMTFEPYRGMVLNPVFTSGVYRSDDAGKTWMRINGKDNWLLENYFKEKGGHIVRIIVNPENANQVFIASSQGVFRSNNALAEEDQIEWEVVLPNQTGERADTSWRGLQFKPDDPTVIYASGQYLYKSEDSGNSWKPMDGPDMGLDFDTLNLGLNDDGFCNSDKAGCEKVYDEQCNSGKKIPRHFVPRIINIDVTPADPDRLYAYILGKEDYRDRAYRSRRTKDASCDEFGKLKRKSVALIYMYGPDANAGKYQWQLVKKTEEWGISYSRLAIVASPKNPNQIAYGAVHLSCNTPEATLAELVSRRSILTKATSSTPGFHVDVHGLAFEPNTEDPLLFCGQDGGISTVDTKAPRKRGCEFRNNGLQAATIWTFDDSELNDEKLFYAIGTQDCGTNIFRKNPRTGNTEWRIISGGDGYGAQIDDQSGMLFVKYNSFFSRYDPETGKSISEASQCEQGKTGRTDFRPMDARNGWQRAYLPNTFKIINHPTTGEMIWGFAELYRRKQAIPLPEHKDNPEQLWDLLSDIGKKEEGQWQRRAWEFDICEANPDYMYIVNSGIPLYDIQPHIFRTTTGGCPGDGHEAYRSNKEELVCVEEIPLEGIPHHAPFGIDYPIISGIAAHPENPNKFWITFTGYNSAAKVWSWEYDESAGQGTWQDEAGLSLNNLPANGIVYQKGSNDRLYIATDAGIYVKDASMDKWEKYGDFPNVRTTELKIHYCSGKLRAATFGRGLWEGDLLPVEDLGTANAFEISAEVTWDGKRAMTRDIHILSDGHLIITGTLGMPKGGRILVEEGGQLTLEGGTITNFCQKNWQGITTGEKRGFFRVVFGFFYKKAKVDLSNGKVEFVGTE